MYKFKKKMTKVVKTVYCETLEIAVTTVSDIINHKEKMIMRMPMENSISCPRKRKEITGVSIILA